MLDIIFFSKRRQQMSIERPDMEGVLYLENGIAFAEKVVIPNF